MSTSPISSPNPPVSTYAPAPVGASVPPVPDSRDAPAKPPAQPAPREPHSQRGAHKPASTHALLQKYATGPMVQSPATLPATLPKTLPVTSPASQSAPTSEMQFAAQLVSRYDGGTGSRNHGADLKSTMVLRQTARLAMTGLPRAEVQLNEDEQELASALAQMDPATRKQFEQRASALRTVPESGYEAASSSLHQDVDREMRRVEADPLSRMKAVFNAPVGIGLLGEDGNRQMAALGREATQMNMPGASPTQREQAFARAVGFKSRMQDQILQKSQDIHAVQKKLWDASSARVKQVLDDAEHYRISDDPQDNSKDTLHLRTHSDDPQWDSGTRLPAYGKTFPYQSVMEKLLSPDGYSQEERGRSSARTLSPEDRTRDLLTFQQGMSEPGSQIRQRVTKLEQQALSTMASPGAGLDAGTPARTLSGMADHPPIYDQNYVQNLADGFQGALEDTDLQTRKMLRQPIAGTADKVLYAIGRFVADLSPIPGMDWFATKLLDASFPHQGGLTGQQVRNIDLGAMFTGLLLGKGEPEGSESALKPLPGGAGEGAPKLKPAPTADPSPMFQPPLSGATASPAFTAGGMPESYAFANVPTSYGPSATPGVYVDPANGQKFILADNQAFPVKYDKDNTSYRIYDPANPTRPTYPVRHDSGSGKWEIHRDVGLPGGAPPISTEMKLKAIDLLRDGWMQKDVAALLGISPNSVSRIDNTFINPDPSTMALCSEPIRQDVIARLDAGDPREQIARDKHIQPETVDFIDQNYRLDRQAPQHVTGARQPTAPAVPRGPASPQPGTSTGGQTYPSAKRPRVEAQPPSGREATRSEILRQAANQIAPEQIAKNLGLTPAAVNEMIERYVMDETRKLHEEFLAEQARQPVAAAGTPTVPPAIRQDVIRRLNSGQTPADIAAHTGLTVLAVEQIRDQYLQDALAHFNVDLLGQ